MENNKNNEYTKVYYEHFAKLTLKYFGYDINSFIDGIEVENPDLQNEKEQIGIEVVQAIFQDMSDVIGYRNKFIKPSMSTEEIKNCFAEQGYENYVIIQNQKFQGLGFELKFVHQVINRICEQVKEKITKKQHYKVFANYGLYVFLDKYGSRLRLENIRTLWQEIKQIEDYKEFSYYYINGYDNLFRINVNSEKIDDIEITIPDWEKMNKQALLFERNEYNKAETNK